MAFVLDLSLAIFLIYLECGVDYTLLSYLLVGNGSKTLFLQDCEAELRRSQEKSLINVRVSFFIIRFVSFNNENNGASSKDPLHVLLDSNMLQFKIGAKQDHWVVNVWLKESFSICQFQYIDGFGNEENLQICQFSVCNILPNKDSAIKGKLLIYFKDNKLLFTFLIDCKWFSLSLFSFKNLSWQLTAITFMIVRDWTSLFFSYCWTFYFFDSTD